MMEDRPRDGQLTRILMDDERDHEAAARLALERAEGARQRAPGGGPARCAGDRRGATTPAGGAAPPLHEHEERMHEAAASGARCAPPTCRKMHARHEHEHAQRDPARD